MANKKKLPVYPPFNPLTSLERGELKEKIERALMKSETFPLPPEAFIGAGIYALYYTGDFPAYAALKKRNANGCVWPIYIGKAVPDGARKGGQGENVNPGQALHRRLKDHAKSVKAAKNLHCKEFKCRFLSVDDVFIPLAESLMIERFRPVWNAVLDGFGNHDPGKGRLAGERPLWDCLHPGREWAERLKLRKVTPEELEKRVRAHLSATLVD